MFCSKCGAKLPDEARFCNRCGCRTIAVPKDATSNIPREEQHADGNVKQHSAKHTENEAAVSTSPRQKIHNSTSPGSHTKAPSRELTDKERAERAARRAKARKKKQRRKRIIMATVCVLLAAIIGVGSWFAFFRNKRDKPEDTEIHTQNLTVDSSNTSPQSSFSAINNLFFSRVSLSQVDGDFTYIVLPDNNICITGYSGTDSHVVIPREIGELPVTEISRGVFYDCSTVNSVEIPDSVTYIGYAAFEGTPWLENHTDDFVIVGNNILLDYNGEDSIVTIPRGVTMICDAFDGCDFIQKVIIPDSVTRIGTSAFDDCDSLNDVVIPPNITIIEERAFHACNSLSTIEISDNVFYIGCDAFCLTPWLSNQTDEFVIVGDHVLLDYNGESYAVSIPEDVKMISNAFFQHRHIKSVTIPESVEIIGDYAFEQCESLNHIEIPGNTAYVGNYAFAYCYSLPQLIIPDSTIYIGDYAFARCEALNYLELSNNLAHIGSFAFADCTSLKYIAIPASVTYIGSDVFEFSSDMQIRISEDSYAESWIDKEARKLTHTANGFDVQVIIEARDPSVSGSGTNRSPENSDFLYTVLPDNTVCITDYLGSEVDLVIPEKLDNRTVSEIGECAFEECGFLESVYIPSGVRYIRENAFYLCYSMENIQLPEGLLEIGGFVFEDCTSLTSINIPDSVTSLGEYAFVDCWSLESITLPRDIKTIPDSLFHNCESLESIIIPNNVTEIGSWAFGGCSALTNINIPDCVAKIGNAAFIYCDSLTTIELPDSVNEIYDDAFGIDPHFSLRVPENSYAHKWVQQNAEEYSIDYTVY